MFRREKRTRRVVTMGLAACAVLIGIADPRIGQASPLRATAPTLGTAASFAVLAGSTVTNTGATGINGNLGVSSGSAVTGFPPGVVTGGTIHAGDAVALQAQSDATTAYNRLAGQPCDFNLTGQDLGGKTLIPGVYCFSSSAQLTGALTLNGQGNPNAVFIFQIGSTLTTASTSSVLPINGAQSCNVFWQVGSSATLGTGTSFTGSILALTSDTLTTGATVHGRALAQTGAVTLDTNQVSSSVCASSGSTATSSPVIPVVVVNTPVPTATSASTAGATTSTPLAATSTALAATPVSTAAAATSTALAATSTALASTPASTAAAATSTAVAATLAAASATSTIVAAPSTPVAATSVTPTTLPTGTATIVPARPTQAVSTPTPTSAKQKTPISAPTSTPSSSPSTTTATPVMQPTIPGTGAGGTYVYSSVRANKLNRAALISAAPAALPVIDGADGSNPTSPLVPLVLLGALAILAGRRVRRLRK